jgi:hypothetical protein
MSLHKFADMVASKGRGDDSLLIHMTPDEVQRLQSFAQANGRSLTINPETGLPEAGMLSDLFKAVAPIALGAFLGPGAFGIAGLGLSAGTAGLVTGGLTTLATGSLSRGLMAGLGAYGGAGLAEGLMGAGVGAAQQSAMGSLSADQIAAEMANTELTKQGVLNQAAADATKSAMANTGQAVSSGFNAVTATPSAMGAFAKQNLGNIAAAASPIMAGAMVPTTTKMPENTNPAYIRQKLYDPFTQTYKSLTPIKASEFGNRNFSDAYTNPQTGQMATLDQRQPTPMAGGGIVALAGGGDVPGYALGGAPKMFSDEELYQQTGDWNKAAALRDQQNVALSHYNATDNAAVGANINKWITDNPFATTADINNAIKTSGLTQDIVNPYLTANTNISDAARYALSHASEMPGGGGLAGLNANILKEFATNPGMNQASIDRLQDIYKVSDADIQRPLSHGSQVAATDMSKAANYLATNPDVQAWINSAEGKAYVAAHPEFDASDIAFTHYQRYGAKEGRKWEEAATKTQNPIVCGPGFRLNAAGTACEPIPIVSPPDPFVSVVPTGFYGNNTGNPLTSTPGDITRNPDNTVTVQPNIPGRPDGGFTGMGQVRDAYTEGGGSLGYTATAPKTAAEHDRMYNNLTDDSLDAYNFLMGKGKNLAQVNAAKSRPLMQPYFTGSNRYKPKFLSYDKDGQVVSSGTSGKTGDAKAAELTAAKTIEIVDSSGYNTETYTAVLQSDGTYLAGNGKRYDVTGKQLAAGGGMMGYAVGGGLGSLGSYSDGGRLLKGPGDGVSDSIPATIGAKQQPARLADGEFVIPARIVSELGNGSTDAGAKKLYAMMDRVQRARGKTTGKNKVAANSRADKYLPA